MTDRPIVNAIVTEIPDTADPTARRVGNPIVWGVMKGLCRIILSRMFEMKVYGRQNVPRTGGVMLISNHASYLDPVVLGVQIVRPISFIAKSELFENRFFGWLIRSLNTFPVRRGESDVGAIREALRRLQEGRVLTMFPEGTRTLDGKLQRIQPGIAMLIRRAKVPVIPAVVDGTFEAWPKGRKLPSHFPVSVLYGPALKIEKLKGQEIVELIESTFRRMQAELRAKRRIGTRI